MREANPREILQSFALPAGEFELRALRQGLINDTFLVLREQQILYVLQRINTFVFNDPKALMGNLQKALQLLQAADYHPIKLVQTKGGTDYFETHDTRCWRLMTYISGSITYNTTHSLQTAFEAGRILGRFHGLLKPANPGDFATILPGFHNLTLRLEQYGIALEAASGQRLSLARSAITIVEEFVEELNSPQSGELPMRICHNDTKLNNILFSEKSGKALCLIDLDTIMEGYFMYDFGDAVRTIVNPAAEDERELGRISFSRPLFVQFIRGLAMEDGLLGKTEIESLPQGAIYMPFLHGLRALTDYLDGDSYYQIAYEGQNLDRSMSLFTFARRAREEVGFMQRVVAENLG